MLDLCYEEDSRADVDMNMVVTGSKKMVEVQATAEHQPFDDEQFGTNDGTSSPGDRVVDRTPTGSFGGS